MKIKITALATAISLFLCGCGSEPSDVLINADDYHGILAVEESTSVTAALMPPTVSETVNTSPDPINSDYTRDIGEEDSSSTEETEASWTAETTESEDLTSVPLSESETTTETLAETTASTASESSATEPSFIFETVGSDYAALNYSEVKGVWISYLELMSLLTGKTESQFTDSIRGAFQNCAAMGLNTVFVHVRSHGDAYYRSDLYPWSKHVTGTIGQAPDFDPLDIMVREAHALNLSFQAWINPYRLCGVSDIGKVSEDYPIGKWYKTSEGDRVVAEGSYYYLNPGYAESNELISAGVKEIVSRFF